MSQSAIALFHWKGLLDKGGGKIEALNPKKREPKQKRKRIWDDRIPEEIRRLQEKHPNLGKEKLYPPLLDFCDALGLSKCPKPMTVGRLIKDMGGLRTFPQKVSHFGKIKYANRQKVLRKPKDLVARYPGHVMALDTIEKQRNSRRMYILTAIDIYTRTTFAIATKSHSSKTFTHFFLIMDMFPYEIKNVLTDNGSEFKKHLSALLKQNDITHFNEKMKEYLTFYNTKRVHSAFKNKLAPLEVLTGSDYYASKLPAECKNGWTYSLSINFLKFARVRFDARAFIVLLFSNM